MAVVSRLLAVEGIDINAGADVRSCGGLLLVPRKVLHGSQRLASPGLPFLAQCTFVGFSRAWMVLVLVARAMGRLSCWPPSKVALRWWRCSWKPQT